jgi:DNA-binding MarR family transcriptional regulator
MSEDGKCWPTQSQIAKGLGVSRETANRRVKKLEAYRWQGKPLIEKKRERQKDGRWENARYTILPISQLRIFKAEPEEIVRD